MLFCSFGAHVSLQLLANLLDLIRIILPQTTFRGLKPYSTLVCVLYWTSRIPLILLGLLQNKYRLYSAEFYSSQCTSNNVQYVFETYFFLPPVSQSQSAGRNPYTIPWSVLCEPLWGNRSVVRNATHQLLRWPPLCGFSSVCFVALCWFKAIEIRKHQRDGSYYT